VKKWAREIGTFKSPAKIEPVLHRARKQLADCLGVACPSCASGVPDLHVPPTSPACEFCSYSFDVMSSANSSPRREAASPVPPRCSEAKKCSYMRFLAVTGAASQFAC
jgi:hypothetical protein